MATFSLTEVKTSHQSVPECRITSPKRPNVSYTLLRASQSVLSQHSCRPRRLTLSPEGYPATHRLSRAIHWIFTHLERLSVLQHSEMGSVVQYEKGPTEPPSGCPCTREGRRRSPRSCPALLFDAEGGWSLLPTLNTLHCKHYLKRPKHSTRP